MFFPSITLLGFSGIYVGSCGLQSADVEQSDESVRFLAFLAQRCHAETGLRTRAGMPSLKRKGIPGKCSLPQGYQHPQWVGGGGPGLPHWLLNNMAMSSAGVPPQFSQQPPQDRCVKANDCHYGVGCVNHLCFGTRVFRNMRKRKRTRHPPSRRIAPAVGRNLAFPTLI